MKGKAIVPLVLGLCVGLVAVKFLVDAVQKARGSTAKAEAVKVVRARIDIDSYMKITEEAVELVETSDDTFAPAQERFTSLEEVLGQVTSKSIPQHSPILKSMIAPEGTPAGMRGMVKEGFRAVSVRIDEVTGVAYQIKPGDWVDVIVVMDVDTGQGRRGKETVAEVILQRVQVAAIGQATTGPPSSQEGRSNVKPAKSATLLVAEDDVPKLHLAGTRGKLTLAMRGDGDTTTDNGAFALESKVFNFSGSGKTPGEQNGEKSSGGLLAAFLAQAANPVTPQHYVAPKPPPQPEKEPECGVTVVTAKGGAVEVSQTVFESAESRTVVGVSSGIITKGDGPTHPAKTTSKNGRTTLSEIVGPDSRTKKPENDNSQVVEEE